MLLFSQANGVPENGLGCLPKICRPYIKSASWRSKYIGCFFRMANRLAKGLGPKPNCTGEENALHYILHMAPDQVTMFHAGGAGIWGEYHGLPEYPQDDQMEDIVSEICFEDHDVVELYERGHVATGISGGQYSDDEQDDEYDDDLLPRGTSAQFMLSEMGARFAGAANLHPSQWFDAFKPERARDHVFPDDLSTEQIQGCYQPRRTGHGW